MRAWLVCALVSGGTFFALVAAIGILRMPDLYTRMHATSKAGTLGVGFLLAAAAVQHGRLETAVVAVLTIAFIVLTAPVAAHVIVRAAYYSGVPMSERSIVDDLRSRRDRKPPTAGPS